MNTLNADIALAHGSGFEIEDGNLRLSAGSLGNAQKAGGLIVAGTVRQIVCSGRGPIVGDAYLASEAGLMRDYLVDNGISERDVLVEDESHSTLGNWAYSAPIIEEAGAERVIGVANRAQASRGLMIGRFVAEKSSFDVIGYEQSRTRSHIKDYGRELAVRSLTRLFIARNADANREDLVEQYEAFMRSVSGDKVKKFIHRNTLSY